MGALPKNKITRAERGKRRKGNTPKLAQDVKRTPVQSHKKGFVAELLRFAGLSAKAIDQTEAQPKAAKATSVKPMDAMPARPTSKRSIAPQGSKRRTTQHKG
jgi:hypothetical protein